MAAAVSRTNVMNFTNGERKSEEKSFLVEGGSVGARFRFDLAQQIRNDDGRCLALLHQPPKRSVNVLRRVEMARDEDFNLTGEQEGNQQLHLPAVQDGPAFRVDLHLPRVEDAVEMGR